jgi:hypothetical protein
MQSDYRIPQVSVRANVLGYVHYYQTEEQCFKSILSARCPIFTFCVSARSSSLISQIPSTSVVALMNSLPALISSSSADTSTYSTSSRSTSSPEPSSVSTSPSCDATQKPRCADELRKRKRTEQNCLSQAAFRQRAKESVMSSKAVLVLISIAYRQTFGALSQTG